MQKLKTINISGCNLLSCHELQYRWTSEFIHEIYKFRQCRCLHNHTDFPQKLNLEFLDIECSTYLNPSKIEDKDQE